MYLPILKRILVIIISLLIAFFHVGFKKNDQDDQYFYFLEYGVLFKVDPVEMDLSVLGFFHPAAPNAEQDPNGLFWARSGERTFAALDARTGKIREEIRLPHCPYIHIITPEGKAYITHHTLTKDGFTISVVDTKKKKLIGEIKNIRGLRTDITCSDGYVYLATIGIKDNDFLYLYSINTTTNRLDEIFKVSMSKYVWYIAAKDRQLYLCRMSRGPFESDPIIEVLDLDRKKIIKEILLDKSTGIEKCTGWIFFRGDTLFVPCRTVDHNYGIALFNCKTESIEKIFPLCQNMYKIVGFKNNQMIYIDNPVIKGQEGVCLYFYDLEKEKEVKMINLLKVLKNQS